MLANGEVTLPQEAGSPISEVVTERIIAEGDVEVATDGRISTV
jgi:hypothetical protein